MVLAALKARLPVMLEGDAGTGKTELAKVVWQGPFIGRSSGWMGTRN